MFSVAIHFMKVLFTYGSSKLLIIKFDIFVGFIVKVNKYRKILYRKSIENVLFRIF